MHFSCYFQNLLKFQTPKFPETPEGCKIYIQQLPQLALAKPLKKKLEKKNWTNYKIAKKKRKQINVKPSPSGQPIAAQKKSASYYRLQQKDLCSDT